MSLKPTYQIVLDTRRLKKDKTYPVKLRITFNRTPKYYNTGYSYSSSDFNSIMGSKPRGTLKERKLELNAIEKRARDIIEETKNIFSFEIFEKKFRTNSNEYQNVYYVLQAYANELEKEERFKSASSHNLTIRSLKSFSKKKKLSFHDITPKFLKSYQKFMLENGKSITTVGIYLRNYRTVLNKAIREGIVKEELYPFGRGKYIIPRGKNPKKSLTLKEIKIIYEYKPTPESTEHFCRDMWIFSYLCNGLNIKDIFSLKYKDIQTGKIYVKRAKTANSNSDSKIIDIIITDEIRTILETWGNKPKYIDNYVFPVLSNEFSALTKYKVINNKTSLINKNIKIIAKKLGIEQSVSTITARHSFATILKRSGVNTSYISDAMGHQNTKTTENYLAGFEDDAKKEISKKLIDFG